MGRKKQYDSTQLLEKSISIFRKNGFHATTTDVLSNEFGINKKSLYAEFGSKLNLFQKTLEYYEKTFLTQMLLPIEEKAASADGIKKVFNLVADYGQKDLCGLGCLLCNTSVERGSLDPCIGPLIDNYYKRIHRGFQHALKNFARSMGKENQIDSQNIAQFLTTTLIGLVASVRAKAPPQQLRGTCKFIETYLDTFV